MMFYKRLAKDLRRLRREDAGVTLIEFAMVAPAVMMLTCGVLEGGMIMGTLATLEGGLKEASRYGITLQQPTVGARIDKIKEILALHTLDFVDINDSTVSIKTFNSFSSKGKPEPFTDTNGNGTYQAGEPFTDLDCDGAYTTNLQGANGAGGAGQVVEYTVKFDWKIVTPIMGPLLGHFDSGTSKYVIPLSASIVVKNEPDLFGGDDNTICF